MKNRWVTVDGITNQYSDSNMTIEREISSAINWERMEKNTCTK